jgi:hypothetical protein
MAGITSCTTQTYKLLSAVSTAYRLYLGGALSAIVTIICTWIVENKAGEPLSIAFTISVYSGMTL